MGLDITAYRRLHEVPASQIELDEDGWPVEYDHYVKFGSLATMHEEYWPGRAAPYDLNPEACYECEDSDYMRAGSYSGYNRWRSLLSMLADEIAFKLEETGAFRELINFSDCEGVIGSIVSDKLYQDFIGYRDFALEYAENDIADEEEQKWFVDKYDEWTSMFEFGRDDGAVEFH